MTEHPAGKPPQAEPVTTTTTTSSSTTTATTSTTTTTTTTTAATTPITSSIPPSPQPPLAPVAPIYHFKILVPAAAAGRIIGKGGTTIAQLQKEAGARVKMSKASEFYPGTTERVCLISGHMEGILKINDFFTENFSSGSIKILVPNSTAGMIIGKGGSYIKQIKEESGAYVQISQKCTDFSLPERCVTVVGELDNIRKACSMILNKIVEDVGSAFRDIRASSITASMFASPSPSMTANNNSHSHKLFSNSSPSSLATNSASPPLRISPPAAAVTPLLTGTSPLTSTASATSSPLGSSLLGGGASPPSSPRSSSSAAAVAAAAAAAASSAATTSSSSSSVWSDMNSAQIIETIKLVLRVSGYGEDAVSEISSAMSTLANYGVLGVGLGLL